MYITVYVLLSCMFQLLSCPSLGRTRSVQKVLNTYSYIRYLIFCLCTKKNQSLYRSKVSRRFQEVKVPRLHDNGPGWW